MRKWLILTLTLAWLAWELVASFDDTSSTWPLTQLIVHYLPPWLYLPAAVVLAAWLPWHFYTNWRRRRREQMKGSSINELPGR